MAIEWFYKIAGETRGPVSAEKLRSLADAGIVSAETQVKRGTGSQWVQAKRVKGLFSQAGVKPSQPVRVLAKPPPVPPPVSASKRTRPDAVEAGRLWGMRPIHWMLVTGGAVAALVVLVGSLAFLGAGDSGSGGAEKPVAKKGAVSGKGTGPPVILNDPNLTFGEPSQAPAPAPFDIFNSSVSWAVEPDQSEQPGDSGLDILDSPVVTFGAPGETPPAPLSRLDDPNVTVTQSLSPADVYAKAAPAVVIIERFGPQGSKPEALGSGFVVESGDVIATNEHVVHGASHLEVKTLDGKIARVTGVLFVDEDADVALLPVPDSLRGTPGLKLAETAPRVGDTVFAIGAPQGLESTFTKGIVSQIRKAFLDYGTVIQHDVSISPGSSGGPLVNDRAEVVGVNTLASNARAGAHNLNFAVASSAVDSALRSRRYQELTELDSYKALVSFQKSLPEASRQKATRKAAGKRRLELRSRWRRLRQGMSMAEVEGLLGPADHIRTFRTTAYWTYGSYPSHGEVEFDKGEVDSWSEPLRF